MCAYRGEASVSCWPASPKCCVYCACCGVSQPPHVVACHSHPTCWHAVWCHIFPTSGTILTPPLLAYLAHLLGYFYPTCRALFTPVAVPYTPHLPQVMWSHVMESCVPYTPHLPHLGRCVQKRGVRGWAQCGQCSASTRRGTDWG